MDLAQYGIGGNTINSISLPYYDGTSGTAITSGGVSLGVNDEDTIKILVHNTEITEGSVVSVHTRDDSTSYQNTSGENATAVLNIFASNTGTNERHVKIWSSPNDNSTTSATVILDIDQTNILNASGETLTVVCPKIQDNHYLVVENVDESRTGTNNIQIESSILSYVVERG